MLPPRTLELAGRRGGRTRLAPRQGNQIGPTHEQVFGGMAVVHDDLDAGLLQSSLELLSGLLCHVDPVRVALCQDLYFGTTGASPVLGVLSDHYLFHLDDLEGLSKSPRRG